jgi:hypothetical protein
MFGQEVMLFFLGGSAAPTASKAVALGPQAGKDGLNLGIKCFVFR